jgi:peptidyl-prolyl cis-trans isomerase SurA
MTSKMRWTCYAAGFALAAIVASPAGAQSPASAPAGPAAPPAAAPAPAAPVHLEPLKEGVVATVNDDIISTYDLRQRMLLLIATSGIKVTQENLPQIQAEALRSLVDERLQIEEIKKRPQLKVSDQEVDDEISQMAKENHMSKEQLLGGLRSAGIDPQTLRDQERAQIGFEILVGGMFSDRARVSSDEVQQTLQRISTSMSKPQYLVGEIYLDANAAGGIDAAVNGANQLEDQILKGAPFQGVARQFSNAATAATGGDAGWQVAGEMTPEIQEALEHMKPGQMSKPIPTKDGVWIVYLRDQRAGGGTTMVSLKQAAIKLAADAPADQVAAATQKLSSLRPQITCDNIDKVTAKSDTVVASDLGESSLTDLAEEFRDTAANLKVGDVSAPIRTGVGLHLIAVCARQIKGDGVPTTEQIEGKLRNQQLSMLARRFMRDLRNSATIEVR